MNGGGNTPEHSEGVLPTNHRFPSVGKRPEQVVKLLTYTNEEASVYIYSFEISRVQKRTVYVSADNYADARAKAEDQFRVIHINNQDPWTYEDKQVRPIQEER